MGRENEMNVEPRSESDHRNYPFGLSSRQLFAFVVLVGLIGPGLAVYTLEQANLSAIADLVWIVGYGTTVLVVWYIWLRPLNLIGSSAQDTSVTDEANQSETGNDEQHDDSDTSDTVETQVQDLPTTKDNTSRISTEGDSESSDPK